MATAGSGLTLGSVQFQNTEIPDTVKGGDQQIIANHHVLGANRVLDAMAVDPLPIEWGGLLLGESAASRARQLDQMAQTGAQQQLTWGSFSYQVIVAKFDFTYKHEWWINYSIVCEVVTSSSGGGGAGTGLGGFRASGGFTIDNSISSDFSSVLSIANAS